MSSLLLTVLVAAGASCCLFLVQPVEGTEVGCNVERGVCLLKVPRRILNSQHLDLVCNSQEQRRTCVNNLPVNCSQPSDQAILKAVDYICTGETRTLLSAELDNCIEPNQETIDAKYNACASAIPAGLTPQCIEDAERLCTVKSLADCCPNSCEIQDRFIYHFGEPHSSDVHPDCAWHGITDVCGVPRTPETCPPTPKGSMLKVKLKMNAVLKLV